MANTQTIPMRDLSDTELDELSQMPPDTLARKYKSEYRTYRKFLRRSKLEDYAIASAWLQFSAFLRDVGPRPSRRHVGGFIDPKRKVFGPDNFRWLELLELAERRRNTTIIAVDGHPTTIRAIADQIGRSTKAVRYAWETGSLPRLIEESGKPPASRSLKWRYPGPKSAAQFQVSFNLWKKKTSLNHEYHVMPDVFFYLSGLEALIKLEKKLDFMGLSDFHNDDQIEVWRVQIGNSSRKAAFHQYVMLRKRLLEALRSISARDPDFAQLIAPSPRAQTAEAISRHFNGLGRPQSRS